MARTETFEAKVYLNQKEAQNAMAELEAQIVDTGAALKKFNEEKNSKKSIEAEQHLKRLRKQYEEAKHGVENYRKALDNLNGQSLNELIRMQKALKRELDRTKPDTEEWKRMAKEYQQVTERIDSLKKAQKGIVTEGQKSTNAFKTLFGKVNEFYGGLLVYAKAAKAAFQAVIGVTKQVVNASQTMGDKWNNGMAAMKTTTEAFFMALSTGDWAAFNDGIAEALKKARELAELEDLLGSFRIAEGYIQSKDVVDIQEARNTATDTKADIEQRKQALEDMKAAIERYNEFVTAKGEATYQDLIKSFDAWKGITFNSEEEFKSFFDRLFRYSTTNRDEELARAQKSYEYTWKNLSARHKDAYGQIVQDYTAAEAKSIALEQVTKQYGEETAKLLQAVEINDEKHTKLVQTYAQYANSVQVVNQQTRTYQRTRDQVNKQLYSEEIKQLQKANNVTLNIWKAQYAKGIIDKATFEAKKLELERQAQQQSIELANKYGQDATDLYTKQWDDIIKQMEDEAKKAADAADKAYQAAMKRVEKQESEQKLVWKRQYANGLMDKQLYEARIAEVEEDFLKQKMATAEKYGKDTDQFLSQLLDRQIARMDKDKAMLNEEMEEMAKYYAHERGEDEQKTVRRESEEPNPEELKRQFQEKLWAKAADIRAAITEDSARTEYETEVAWAQKLAEQKKITAEEAERYILQAKLKYAQAAAQQVSQITEQASNFVAALKETESAQLEAEYQRQLTAAGDNADERERIDAEYEQKKLDLQKKYADVDMAINIAKTVANGAAAVVKALADPGGVAGYILAGLVGATTAAEVATIIAQRNAIKNASVSSSGSTSSAPKTGERKITGYAEGGYTGKGLGTMGVTERPARPPKRGPSTGSGAAGSGDEEVVGVVHANEWVAPAWMVRRNPVMFANLEQYRQRGYAEGGYTGKGLGTMGVTERPARPPKRGPSTGSGTGPMDGSIETIVRVAVREELPPLLKAMRVVLVRHDLTELDAQTEKFEEQTSR